jgi:hypothetical protein
VPRQIANRFRDFAYPPTASALYVSEPFSQQSEVAIAQGRRFCNRDEMGKRVQIDSNRFPAQSDGFNDCGPTAHKWIEDDLAWPRIMTNDLAHEERRKACGVPIEVVSVA